MAQTEINLLHTKKWAMAMQTTWVKLSGVLYKVPWSSEITDVPCQVYLFFWSHLLEPYTTVDNFQTLWDISVYHPWAMVLFFIPNFNLTHCVRKRNMIMGSVGGYCNLLSGFFSSQDLAKFVKHREAALELNKFVDISLFEGDKINVSVFFSLLK